jgi:hypothetical protein
VHRHFAHKQTLLLLLRCRQRSSQGQQLATTINLLQVRLPTICTMQLFRSDTTQMFGKSSIPVKILAYEHVHVDSDACGEVITGDRKPQGNQRRSRSDAT